MALGLGIILGHQSGVTSRRASCNQVSRVISRQPLSVFKLLAGVLWRQAFAKDLGFEHMFERRRLARMADSGGGGGREKGGKNLLPPLLQLQVHRPLPWNIFYCSQSSIAFIIHWEGSMIHLVGIESDWAPTKIHLLWRLIVSYLLHRKAWHSHSSWYRSDIPCTEDHSVHTHCHRKTHNANHIQRLFENTLRERLQHQLVKTTADKPQLKENTDTNTE